jgi:hypothetical protein
VIIRIMNEGQYRVEGSLRDELNAIDNRIVDHVSGGDETGFKRELARLISTIKERGKPLDPGEIVQSELIVPPGDLTLEEAQKVFSGHGLIKD